jgi:hypothetical protein
MSRLCPGKEVSAASDDFWLTGEKGLVETLAADCRYRGRASGLGYTGGSLGSQYRFAKLILPIYSEQH